VSAARIEAGVAGRGSRNHPRPNPSGTVQASTPARRIVVAGVRGGQGTSTVAAALAIFAAGHVPTRLAAVEPDVTAALLGLPALAEDERRALVVVGGLELGCGPSDYDNGTFSVVDAGRVDQLPATEDDSLSLVVLRGPCYVALRSLVAAGGPRPGGVVVVREAGRSLTAGDVADITGVPVIAEIDVTPAVARTIAAGALVSRLHRVQALVWLRRSTVGLLAEPASRRSVDD